jgi:hypothetical protein
MVTNQSHDLSIPYVICQTERSIEFIEREMLGNGGTIQDYSSRVSREDKAEMICSSCPRP